MGVGLDISRGGKAVTHIKPTAKEAVMPHFRCFVIWSFQIIGTGRKTTQMSMNMLKDAEKITLAIILPHFPFTVGSQVNAIGQQSRQVIRIAAIPYKMTITAVALATQWNMCVLKISMYSM